MHVYENSTRSLSFFGRPGPNLINTLVYSSCTYSVLYHMLRPAINTQHPNHLLYSGNPYTSLKVFLACCLICLTLTVSLALTLWSYISTLAQTNVLLSLHLFQWTVNHSFLSLKKEGNSTGRVGRHWQTRRQTSTPYACTPLTLPSALTLYFLK